MTAPSFSEMYARVQRARFEKRPHVEITRDEYNSLIEMVTYPSDSRKDTLFGFAAVIVDALTE